MKFSQSTAYAVHAMLLLAGTEEGVPVPCRQLARSGRMPERFLLQILRELVGMGLLRSVRGVDGGYCLARPPAEITLWDIVAAFEGPPRAVPTALESLSPHARQQLSAALKSAGDMARQVLQRMTLDELLRAESAQVRSAVPSDGESTDGAIRS